MVSLKILGARLLSEREWSRARPGNEKEKRDTLSEETIMPYYKHFLSPSTHSFYVYIYIIRRYYYYCRGAAELRWSSRPPSFSVAFLFSFFFLSSHPPVPAFYFIHYPRFLSLFLMVFLVCSSRHTDSSLRLSNSSSLQAVNCTFLLNRCRALYSFIFINNFFLKRWPQWFFPENSLSSNESFHYFPEISGVKLRNEI